MVVALVVMLWLSSLSFFSSSVFIPWSPSLLLSSVPCCWCWCCPVPLFFSLWPPFFFVVVFSLSLPCQLFPFCKQLLTGVGCWWPSSSLPHHPLSLLHFPWHWMLHCFVVVLIHNPPHKQVLVVMESLQVCCLVPSHGKKINKT